VRRLVFSALLLVPCTLESQFSAREYAQRRAALASRLPDAVVVVLGEREPTEDYLEFNQNPAMLYLTGIKEPSAALVMVKESGRLSESVFVLPRDPAAETWTGTRLGTDGAYRATGIPGRERSFLPHVLDSLGTGKLPFYVIGTLGSDSLELTPDDQFIVAFKRKHPSVRVLPGNGSVAQLRTKKTPEEFALLRRSVEITVQAHNEAIQSIRPDMYEYEVEALIEYAFRRNGAERPSFATIVGSGPNATTLHYWANDRQIRAGDVIVMDIGASYKGYAADVTRTVPATGTYSPEQRQIYQIVRDAQAAAEAIAKPGARWQAVSDTAEAVISAGLTRLGLIESPNATFDVEMSAGVREMPQHFLYYMHGLGHGIGLDVHDPSPWNRDGTIGEGAAYTIEPGIYVRANLLETLDDTPRNRALIAKIRQSVERYRNIGVRIEDDYIITDKGVEWISRAPREINEIEALMRRATP
jgi:Xaa-Pro aminopeptidase